MCEHNVSGVSRKDYTTLTLNLTLTLTPIHYFDIAFHCYSDFFAPVWCDCVL